MKTLVTLVALFVVGTAGFSAQPSIELQGVVTGVGPTKLSLFDKTGDNTRWVEVGQTFAGYKVSAYDAATETVTLIKEGGGELRLRLNTASVKEAPASPALSPAAVAEITRAVLNNLRQISGAADQYYLENGKNSVTLAELVGPTKYIKQLKPIDGESYEGLTLKSGVGLSVTTAQGVSVSYAP